MRQARSITDVTAPRRRGQFSSAALSLIPATMALGTISSASDAITPDSIIGPAVKFYNEIPTSQSGSSTNIGSKLAVKEYRSANATLRQLVDPIDFHGKFDKIRRVLGRLSDGWFGEGSVAPRERALEDLDVFASNLDPSTHLPEVEAQEDTGIITLRWLSENGGIQVSTVFTGDGLARVFVVDVKKGETDSPIVVDLSDQDSRLFRNSVIAKVLVENDRLRV